jgi:serine/threonine protein kinase
MQVLYDDRVRRCEEWDDQKLSFQQRIGTGNYGKVFKVQGCPYTAGKLVSIPKSRTARHRALSEHLIGILQSFLIVKKISFFYPLHFGVSCEKKGPAFTLTMYMELFEGSLESLAPAILLAASDWKTLIFQVLHGLVAISNYFSISHNDVYARNIIVKRVNQAVDFTTRVGARQYSAHLSFVAALSDFGAASGGPIDCELVPPTEKRLLPFCVVSPLDKHILYYDIRAFSRDPISLLTSVIHSVNLPSSPVSIKLWAAAALRYITSHMRFFEEPGAQLLLFHAMFSEFLTPRSVEAGCVFDISSSNIDDVRHEAFDLLKAKESLL